MSIHERNGCIKLTGEAIVGSVGSS